MTPSSVAEIERLRRGLGVDVEATTPDQSEEVIGA
jgi:hypothetical protein